jgi:excisionase family DNA binding protein
VIVTKISQCDSGRPDNVVMGTEERHATPLTNVQLLKIRDAANIIAASRGTVYRLIQDGELTPVRVRGHLRIDARDLRDLIERRRVSR